MYFVFCLLFASAQQGLGLEQSCCVGGVHKLRPDRRVLLNKIFNVIGHPDLLQSLVLTFQMQVGLQRP